MASTINATSTGSGGLITTGNSVNQLELQTGDTTRLVIDQSGNVTIQGQGDLRLADSDSSHYVALQAPGTVSSNVTFTLPSADGTSGQVIQTNGSGTLSFVTPAGGSWTYLSTVSASGAATADVETTFDSTYDAYAIVVTNVIMQSANFYSRLKVNASYQTANYRYHASRCLSSDSTYAGTVGNTAAQIDISGRSMDVSTYPGSTGNYVMYVHNPASTTKYKTIYWNGYFTNDTEATVMSVGSAAYTGGTQALTGVRFYASSGNISGTFRLYGIKNS